MKSVLHRYLSWGNERVITRKERWVVLTSCGFCESWEMHNQRYCSVRNRIPLPRQAPPLKRDLHYNTITNATKSISHLVIRIWILSSVLMGPRPVPRVMTNQSTASEDQCAYHVTFLAATRAARRGGVEGMYRWSFPPGELSYILTKDKAVERWTNYWVILIFFFLLFYL